MIPAEFRQFDPRRPSVRLWNGFLQWMAKFRPILGDFPGGALPFPHPFQVTASRFTDGLPGQYDPDLAWKIDVSAGCVNDTLVTIPFLRTNDPRGWQMPQDWPAPKPGAADYDPRWVERPLLDAFDDPPFLVISAPPAVPVKVTGARDFAPNAPRIPFFRTDDFKDLDLFLAFVFLSDDTATAQAWIEGIPPRLKRFRVFVGQRPISGGSIAGGWQEVAWLWLARDKTDGVPDPKTDLIYVEPRLFWCVASQVLQPSLNVFPPQDGTNPINDLFEQLAEDQVDQTLESAATTGFWTQ